MGDKDKTLEDKILKTSEPEKRDILWNKIVSNLTHSDDFRNMVTNLSWLSGQVILVGVIFWLLTKMLSM